MALSRRRFIKCLLTGGVLVSSPSVFSALSVNNNTPTQVVNQATNTTILYSAGKSNTGEYFIAAMASQVNSSDGKPNKAKQLFKTALPARAHDVSLHPHKNELVVFARRPRHFILILDAISGQVLQRIETAQNRPLYGHGVFSLDGQFLYLSANDLDAKQGVIMVLDTSDHYRQVAEFSAGGIGTHEICLLRDGKTLLAANGGILTHPETGRSKLNLESMTPALTYLDTQSGRVIDDYRLDEKYHQLSIRHLDVNQNDSVCFAMQYQGSRHHRLPLVGFHCGEEQLQLAQIPSPVLVQMKNYCGSVCADASGELFAVSSPRGNLITTWNAQGEFVESLNLADGCGIAKSHQNSGFYLSSGKGEIHHYSALKNTSNIRAKDLGTNSPLKTATTSPKISKSLANSAQSDLLTHFNHYHWDNHLLSHIV